MKVASCGCAHLRRRELQIRFAMLQLATQQAVDTSKAGRTRATGDTPESFDSVMIQFDLARRAENRLPGGRHAIRSSIYKEKKMKLRSLLSISAAVLLFVSMSGMTAVAQPAGKIHGKVSDPTGVPRTAGTVSLSTDNGHTLKYSFPVGGTGEFKGEGIAPGTPTTLILRTVSRYARGQVCRSDRQREDRCGSGPCAGRRYVPQRVPRQDDS